MPKIHKVDIPFRPIISTVNSPIHFLAKILNNELKNFIKKPKSHINNSFELKEKLVDLTIPADCILVSLDVSYLFTNIPYELVINSLEKRFKDIHFNSKIPFQEILETTKFLFDNTFFIFDNTIYQQLFGTPMGSPIYPLFADIVMDDLETTCLKLLKEKSDCIPLFY